MRTPLIYSGVHYHSNASGFSGSDTSAAHEYFATVVWQRSNDERFIDQRYSRAHRWRFDGGAVIAASSSPKLVPLPLSVDANVDPEEAFVAALSACHMLFFLSHAAQRGFIVDRYEDQAVGTMGSNALGRVAMLKVALRPRIRFGGERQPASTEVEALHHRSHQVASSPTR